jgi:hypothetical protein
MGDGVSRTATGTDRDRTGTGSRLDQPGPVGPTTLTSGWSRSWFLGAEGAHEVGPGPYGRCFECGAYWRLQVAGA